MTELLKALARHPPAKFCVLANALRDTRRVGAKTRNRRASLLLKIPVMGSGAAQKPMSPLLLLLAVGGLAVGKCATPTGCAAGSGLTGNALGVGSAESTGGAVTEAAAGGATAVAGVAGCVGAAGTSGAAVATTG